MKNNNTIINSLKKIEEQINVEWRYFTNIINNLGDESSELFEDVVELRDCPSKAKEKAKKIRGRYGIYIFLLDEPLELTEGQVNTYNKLKGAKYNRLSELSLIEGDCLYVGSCLRNSLYTRINQHFMKGYNGNSLHLGDAERCLFKGKTTCYAFPIKKEYEPYLKIVIPLLEKKLHEDYYPIAGSSRT